MLFFCIFLVVSLMGSQRNFHVSGCNYTCTDKPIFTPSKLVVKYGDPTSATCIPCKDTCNFTLFSLEKPVGKLTENGTTLLWTVDKLTNWDPSLDCYYYTHAGDHCCTTLPVTVYQPPERVSVSFDNHTGPMYEGHHYTLRCTVEKVAPVENLVVTFYRGQTALGQQKSNMKPNKKPVTDTFTLNVNINKEDDGAQYRCEAELELEGLQHPPVVTSENIAATVYYGPYVHQSANPDPIKITEGQSLQLNCSAEGNPSPSYTWIAPLDSLPPYNNSILTIKSVSAEHKGQYNCTVSNENRRATVIFTVDVQVDVIPYIIIAVVIAAVVIGVVGSMVYFHYYRNNKMGKYNLKDVFHFHTRQAVPLEA